MAVGDVILGDILRSVFTLDGYMAIYSGADSNALTVDGAVGFGRSPLNIATVSPRVYILRRSGYWGLGIQGDISNQADVVFNSPSAPANERVTQFTHGTDGYFHIRSLTDAGAVKKYLFSGDTGNGFVGIGDATPSDQLDVNGTLRISGNNSPGWTTAGWARGICFPSSGYAIMWRRGTGTLSRGIGYTSDNSLYFIRSPGDDASGAPTYDMVLDGSGDLSIGTGVAASYKLEVAANATSSFAARFLNDGNATTRWGIAVACGEDAPSGTNIFFEAQEGDGTATGRLQTTGAGTFALADVSDVRLKSDVAPTQLDALALVERLKVIEYSRTKDAHRYARNECGLSAQNCRDVFPQMVAEDASGLLMTMRSELIPVLVKAVQQLTKRIEELERGN